MKSRAKWFFFLPIIGVVAVTVFGWVVMGLWNYVAVPALHVGVLSFWQALGLLVLCRILFGSFGKGGGRYRGRPLNISRQKWMNMSEEEKITFRDEWRKRWRGGDKC